MFTVLNGVAPALLDEVLAELRPPFDRAVAAAGVLPEDFAVGTALFAPRVADIPEVVAFRNAVVTWTQRHHLDADWVRALVVNTVAFGGDFFGERRWTPYAFDVVNPMSERECRVDFRAPGWDVTDETEAEVRRRLTTAFAQWLDDYVARLRRLAVQRYGGQQTPTRRDDAYSRHMAWFLRWQVLQWTMADIARDDNVGRRKKYVGADGVATMDTGVPTVRDAIRQVARDLGLKLRAGRPGRPPGARKPNARGKK